MKSSIRPLMAALVVGAAGLSQLHTAHAGCGITPPALKPNAWYPSTQGADMLRFADFRPGEEQGRLLPTSDDGWHYDAPIVGMWRFTLTTPGPNGTPVVVDDGYAQWHSDRTEIQNSGLHAPISSNFCLGVWQQVGFNSYKLNHFPLAWDANGTNPANAIRLTETVRLTDANHMTGTFTLKVYPWTTTDSLNVAGGAVATVTGTVTAERITINSTVPGLP
jgi:hypothetical protein